MGRIRVVGGAPPPPPGLACAGRKCAHFFGIFRAFSGGPQDPQKWPKMTPQTPQIAPKTPHFWGVSGGLFGGSPGGGFWGVPRTPQDPRNMGTFGLSIRGEQGDPPGEDGGGERGATMPTTSGVESERPWSDLSTRESKAVIEGILTLTHNPITTPSQHPLNTLTIPSQNLTTSRNT